jgi:transcriptional regulator with XRE-family HTH domain
MPSYRAQYEREQLSARLRQLRRTAGLSSALAARAAGFSQSKLSKIETGALLPSFTDGEALCRALAASPADRDEILDLLSVLHEEILSARVILRRGAYRLQRQVGRIEAETSHYRDLQVACVSGLLQTRDYMTRMAGTGWSPADRERFIASRIARQSALRDDSKRFTFLMTEGALRWRAGPGLMMAEQMSHISEISQLPSVRVGVVPWTTEAPPGVFPGHEVHIYDERMVIVGIETATANIQDPRDIALYLELFRTVEEIATFGDPARSLLDAIATEYAAAT